MSAFNLALRVMRTAILLCAIAQFVMAGVAFAQGSLFGIVALVVGAAFLWLLVLDIRDGVAE